MMTPRSVWWLVGAPLAVVLPLVLWRDVFAVPPNPRIEDLADQPKFLVTAKGPKDLDRQLRGIHGNR